MNDDLLEKFSNTIITEVETLLKAKCPGDEPLDCINPECLIFIQAIDVIKKTTDRYKEII